RKVWPAIFANLDGEGRFNVGMEEGKGYVTSPESNGLFRELVFLKYGITFRQLMVQVERDPSAYRKLIRVHYDFFVLRAGIIGLSELKLKLSDNHFHIMVQGFDHGIAHLNEWELASCFDEICPCGQRHSVGYMKKLRIAIKKACERAMASANQPTTIDIS